MCEPFPRLLISVFFFFLFFFSLSVFVFLSLWACLFGNGMDSKNNRSIKLNELDKINTELESDSMIKAIHDVKGIDMGNSMIRYKAEIDFNGRELTRNYLEKHSLPDLMNVNKMFFYFCLLFSVFSTLFSRY